MIYMLVPLIISFNENLFNIKFYLLTIIGLFIFILMKVFKVTNTDLGINSNYLPSLKRNIPLVVLFLIIIMIISFCGYNKYNPTETMRFYLFYIFISCPIQEFLYRGIFGYFEKELIKNKLFILLLSSFCYSFVHIIYRDFFTCLLTFFIGIIWYLLYRKDYNLSGVCVSHIVLGILTIALGIIN